jgi:hypothetical protein
MNDKTTARAQYHVLLNDLATLISKAMGYQTGFVSSALALMEIKEKIDPAMDALIAWEEVVRHEQQDQKAEAEGHILPEEVAQTLGVGRVGVRGR